MYYVRLVPDGTRIQFMRGRIAGLVISALLSILSVILYFAPGVNLGVDFRGGIAIEARFTQPADFGAIRGLLDPLNLGHIGLQEIGSPIDVSLSIERQPGDEEAQQRAVNAIRQKLTEAFPGVTFQRVEAVGAAVSGELFTNGMVALGLSLFAMLAYIWFRFEWQFGIGAVVTLVLDVTKTIGFYVLFNLEFNLSSIAAILAIMGYSINDKVVVYDRVRENLRKYKAMPLRELIDLSINETLNRTIGTSMASFLSAMPLIIFGGEALREFSLVMLFGIFIATSSSIFIAAPILLFLGENRLRRGTGPVDEGKAAETPAG